MPARTGQQVLDRLREQPPALYHRGERITDVTTAPGIKNGVHSLADLYDHQWAHRDQSLYPSPTSGDPVGITFQIPTTVAELTAIGDAMHLRAAHTQGMMGRMPDYLNRAMVGYAGGAEFLRVQGDHFAENMRTYYEYLREHDLCLTHTLINPQSNRSVGAAKQADPFLAARVKEETDAGIVVRGARMLATLPISDEIMVFPSTLLKSQEEDAPYAFGFAIPNNTPGLQFQCRETVDYDASHYDHPLGSRYEELDAVVFFDDVFVPWERVFLYRDVAICNQAYAATGTVLHMAHQVICKNIAKTEFLLGLVSLLVESIGIGGFQHVQEKTAEIWINLETMKAFRFAAEQQATRNDFGVMTPAKAPLDAARNLYPKLYPRMIEIVRQLGASGLVAMPTEADLHGPLAAEIERYYQSAQQEAKDRIPLFRLAWDTALSAFAARQAHYEFFFFGDPVRMAGALLNNHDRTPYMDAVRDFLARSAIETGGNH
ncbi:MAG TPA: 4-hydroxyphenylacetate 3-monooxygenase, oxygenase component [Caldilineaceae bacterium]|nr:4-hydroxyphenylacetate 3-monooxygenase, oxygenase component [Caldilineaceae bacterium]